MIIYDDANDGKVQNARALSHNRFLVKNDECLNTLTEQNIFSDLIFFHVSNIAPLKNMSS